MTKPLLLVNSALRSLFCALLVLLAVAATASSPAWAGGDRFERLRERIRTRMDDRRIPSLAVAVARKDEILWAEAFGWSDREKEIPATAHTMYSLASITKPFTATGLMLLVEQGRIDLGRPIDNYLGDAKLTTWVGDSEDATVRRVANHTSGLPLHHHFFPSDEPYPRPPMVETIRRYGNIVTAPGKEYVYSNLGYGILEYAIERVSGKSYGSFLREEVFLPLGLEHTAVALAPDGNGRHAVRYDSDGEPLPFYDFDHRGASAIFACVHDLVRFGMFHLRVRMEGQKAVLSDRAIKEMQKSTVRKPEGGGYGIGWETYTRRGYRIVTHRGGMGGVSTSLVLVPSAKIAVAVLASGRTDLPQRVTDEILSTVIPRYARTSTSSRTMRVSAQVNRQGSFKPPKKLLGTWTGTVETYNGSLPLTFVVTKASGVRARLDDQPETEVGGVTLRKSYFSGWMSGDIGTEDANRRRYLLGFSLKLRGEVLNGSVTAVSFPNEKLPNALSHWVELKKQRSR
jgi:CubicO group peptidase (beta-lactamase class C family)